MVPKGKKKKRTTMKKIKINTELGLAPVSFL